MIDQDERPEIVPLFQADYRGSGLLLHVNALPSPFGIGDVGPAAFDWVDRLQATGQQWWQALPLGSTGDGTSPSESLSSFAGNALLISPDYLVQDGLLRAHDTEGYTFPAAYIDYDVVIPFKHRLIDMAFANYKAGARPDLKTDFEHFRQEHTAWLEDYALFSALKTKLGGVHYLEWPAELVMREEAAMEHARRELSVQMEKVCFAQFLVFRRGRALKEYANTHGVRLIGDLPFFVSADSSDVWSRPEYFLLDENRRPRVVAGSPPDRFNSLGRFWGNPAYNWEALREGGYQWHIDRIRTALVHVDVVRLDHFRGFAAAWQIAVGAPSARCGRWIQGPGAGFFTAVLEQLGSLPFIAEDLGMVTADVWHLLDQIGTPGTRVLQSAFDGHSDNPHLPENYVPNTVAYTGTHDGPATRSWYEKLSAHERRNLWRYLRRPDGEAADVAPALIRLAWSSRAALAITPLQDLLNLGTEACGSVTGHPSWNWCWRATGEMLNAHAFDWLRQLTKGAKRAGVPIEVHAPDQQAEAAP
jgi:4-alpha-glucanotransferase